MTARKRKTWSPVTLDSDAADLLREMKNEMGKANLSDAVRDLVHFYRTRVKVA